MNRSRDLCGGVGASRDERADASKPTGQQERVPGFFWILHALMFLAGLGLLSLAHSLQSLNSELRATNGDALFSTAEWVRELLWDDVSTAGAALLVLSVTGLIVTWCQARWPRALEDWLSRAWRRRYRLALPLTHRRWSQKYALLTCGVAYGWALGYAVVPALLAFHLVPNLYEPGPVASATAATRAPELINRSTMVLSLTVSMTYVVFTAGMFGASTWRLRRMESWLDQGVAVCLECGYPLRGLDSPACPECGAAWSQWYPSKDGRPVLPT